MRIMMRDGLRMQVIRPSDPQKAVELALEFQKKNDVWNFQRVPELVEALGIEYTFAGFLSEDGKSILDANGAVVDTPQAGDSFVTFTGEIAPPAKPSVFS